MVHSDTGLLRQPFLISSSLRRIPSLVDEWLPALPSKALKRGQIATTTVLGQRIVVYRSLDGTLGALEDRCPHRGVRLSLGSLDGNRLQCSYHGWCVDSEGRVCSVPGLGALDIRAKKYVIRDGYGLLWIFVGDPAVANEVPLPCLEPFATRETADLLFSSNIRAHWSLVLDNGFDLFHHHHLHRGLTFFSSIRALEAFGCEAESFCALYAATLRDIINRSVPGHISLRFEHNVLRVDFDGFPIIHATATPTLADGSEVRAWWLVSFRLPSPLRALQKLWAPFISRPIMRAFRQDIETLESEQDALDSGVGLQREVNPAIRALHDHLEKVLLQQAERAFSRRLGVTETNCQAILPLVRKGELVVVSRVRGILSLLEPHEVNKLLTMQPLQSALQYQHICLV